MRQMQVAGCWPLTIWKAYVASASTKSNVIFVAYTLANSSYLINKTQRGDAKCQMLVLVTSHHLLQGLQESLPQLQTHPATFEVVMLWIPF